MNCLSCGSHEVYQGFCYNCGGPVSRKEKRRAAERLYAKEHGVSIEFAMMRLGHDRAAFVAYRDKVMEQAK